MRILLCAVAVLWLGACNDKTLPPIVPDAAPGQCGGDYSPICGAGFYCDSYNNSCGITQTGMCTPMPTSCPPPGTGSAATAPVCGCSGNVYATECEAYKDGQDLNNNARLCRNPAGTFRCGYEVCDVATQYCEDREIAPLGHHCIAIPAACTAGPTCDCLVAEPCGAKCAVDGFTGGVTLSCLGKGSTP